MSAASSAESGRPCPKESRASQTRPQRSNGVTLRGKFVWTEKIVNDARCSDQINRASFFGDVRLSAKRMGCTLIVHLQPFPSAHCGQLVFPDKWQPGVKKQAAGGQCRRMPSIKNLAHDLRR